MQSYLLPDLTGSNPLYTTTNDLYTIYTEPQRIAFDTPVYLSSIHITIVNSTTTLAFGTDWTYATNDINTTEISKIMNIDPTFNATLVNAISITANRAAPYQIVMNYQRLFQVASSLASTPKLLALDPNKTNQANSVTDTYQLNTFNGQNVIWPSSGPFFADSVTISLPTNPVTVLIKNTDYVIFGVDAARTKATSNTSGVYTAIMLTRQYAGPVTVSYHAYGGVVTLYDMIATYQSIANVENYLNSTQFLTATDLGNNVLITNIISRLAVLESLAGVVAPPTPPTVPQSPNNPPQA